MKICMFARTLPVHCEGGMEQHSWALAKKLVERDNDVTIITSKHPYGLKFEKKEGVKIYYVGDRIAITYLSSYWKEAAKKLEELLEKGEKIDIIHSQSVSAWYYVKKGLKDKYKVPLVTTVHGTNFTEIQTTINTKLSLRSLFTIFFQIYSFIFVAFRFFRSSDMLIAVQKHIEGDLVHFFLISNRKIRVILNGIDIKVFLPKKNTGYLREKYGIKKTEKVILATGRIIEGKGFQYLVQAFSMIKKKRENIKLMIVGTGPYLGELRKLVADFDILEDVILAGHISQEGLSEYYSLCDIFVLPTICFEGPPLVILEAMACGKPVVASEIDGIPATIDNQVGVLVPPRNVFALENGILKILENPTLMKRLGRNARRKVLEQFTLDKMVDSTVNVYKNVIRVFKIHRSHNS